MGIGECASLAAALMWTVSSLFWGRINLSALALNLCKNVVASGLLLIHIGVLLIWNPEFQIGFSSVTWGWMGLSGLVGIVIGDTFYFRSIQILGPRLAMVMATTSPIFAWLLGWAFLQEDIRWLAVIGILMVVIGVGVVVGERKAKKEQPGLFPGKHSVGVVLGLLAAVCQAVGGMFSKLGMNYEECDPVIATFMRIFLAALVTLAVVIYQKQLAKTLPQVFRWKVIRMLLPATIIGSWLGIWFSQVGYQATRIAVAQTLMATCPLFAIPFVTYLDGHRISLVSVLGTVVAIAGIYFVVL